MSMETRAVGDAIRAARMKKGLTQDALRSFWISRPLI